MKVNDHVKEILESRIMKLLIQIKNDSSRVLVIVRSSVGFLFDVPVHADEEDGANHERDEREED